MSNINYPYAYGTLDARVEYLADRFCVNCSLSNIKYTEEQISILKNLIYDMRKDTKEAAIEFENNNPTL